MSKYGPEFWNGESGAHRRVMMKAAGYGDLDIRTKPHIGVPNSFQEGFSRNCPSAVDCRSSKTGDLGSRRYSCGIWYSCYMRQHPQWC